MHMHAVSKVACGGTEQYHAALAYVDCLDVDVADTDDVLTFQQVTHAQLLLAADSATSRRYILSRKAGYVGGLSPDLYRRSVAQPVDFFDSGE